MIAAAFFSCTSLWAQDAEPKTESGGAGQDPYASDDPFASEVSPSAISPERAGRETATLLVRTEIYQLDTLEAAKLLDEMGEDAAELRSTLLARAGEGKATLIDSAAIRLDAGLTATVEGIVETIYPTEYEPPGVGRALAAISEEPPQSAPKGLLELFQGLANDATPCAFETRNTGSTIEVEVRSVEAEQDAWDVRWAPEVVELVGESLWGEGLLKQPTFASTRLNSSFRIRDGEWTLAGLSAVGHKDGVTDPKQKRIFLLHVKRVR